MSATVGPLDDGKPVRVDSIVILEGGGQSQVLIASTSMECDALISASHDTMALVDRLPHLK